MEIEIAEYSGYCFGVKRALNIATEALEKRKSDNRRVYTLGSIIHNPGVVQDLSGKGLISVNDIKDIQEGSIFVVRSHGISPKTLKALDGKDIKIIDATCPFVKKAQSRARKLSKDGFYVVVIGEKNHPEVCGLREQVDRDKIDVLDNLEDLGSLDKKKRIGVVVQTTQTMEKLKELTCGLLDKAIELYIINTICDTTKNRQDSVRELSRRTDLMIVVGGKNSANTTHLAEISRENNPNTFHIESKTDIMRHWFKKARKIGISGGASTPEKDILEIIKEIEDMGI